MELEDMKALWQQMDNKFEQQKTANERLFKYLLKEKSIKPLGKISGMEYLNVVSALLIFAALLFAIPHLGKAASVIACYTFLMLALLITAYLSVKNISMLKGIDIGNNPVNTVMEQTQKFKLLTKKFQLAYVILGPLFIGTASVVMFQVVHNVNILDNITKYMPRLGVAILAYTIIIIAVYQQSYFKNLRAIQNNLKEIEEFNR